MKAHGHAGATRSPTWLSWRAMRQRVLDPGHSDFKNYGGRGITITARWDSFANFLRDMGERPPGTTLERKKNDRGYSPANCRWATPSEQARNRRPPTRDDLGRFAPAGTGDINHAQTVRMGG